MQGIARGIDRAILGHVHKFLANKAGKLQALTSTNAKDTILDAREQLNRNLAYPQGRNMILAPGAETAMLQTELFIAAYQRGDGGAALREASLGRVLGFDTYMDQNMPANTKATSDYVDGTANGAESAGTTGNMAVTITGYNVAVGEFAVFDDEGQPTTVIGRTLNGGDTTGVSLGNTDGTASPLKYAVTNASTVTVYKQCAVVGDYAALYSKGITLGSWNEAPKVGQLIAFGAPGANRRLYTIIEGYVDPTNAAQWIVWLDRPFEVALTNAQKAFPGPAGTFNLAMHKDALALVSRPLALPNTAMGVRSQVANYNDIAMRVTMQYQIAAQGTVVTLDLLAGIALLDARLGCVLLG